MPAAVLIASIPSFVSPEEHRSLVGSTPASFNDIPPVLRYKEENVSVSINPSLDGFSTQDAAHGTLFVIESALVFMSATGKGFQIQYPSITLHAVSRSESADPCIYCQLDDLVDPVAAATTEDDLSDIVELSIIPQNPSSLESIFEALSICASLHPDKPASSDEEDEDENDMDTFDIFTGDHDQELSQVGRAALAHLESVIHDPQHLSTTQNGNLDGASDGEHGSPADSTA